MKRERVPELTMEGRCLGVRPREIPPGGPGSALVPSPLQSGCRVCSRPGTEMLLAVLAGLKEGKKKFFFKNTHTQNNTLQYKRFLCHENQVKS